MRRAFFLVVLAMALVATACGGGGSSRAGGKVGDGELAGLFKIEAGACSAGGVEAGSYFRMIQPGGKIGEGPFVANGDSPCADKTYSPLFPGSDGGLITGAYQPQVAQPFDGNGNGVSTAITKPTPFFAVTFANATNEKDPQTGVSSAAPVISLEDGKITGDLSAFAAAWNNQHFNQGAPKPGGKVPGLTSGPTGTYDSATKAYKLDWTSQIEGGPFNNFTGVWHLEGIFEPKK